MHFLVVKKIGSHVVVNPHLPHVIDPKRKPRWYPAKVLDTVLVKKRGAASTKWLIQWVGSPEEVATWKFADDIKGRYPDFGSLMMWFAGCSLRSSWFWRGKELLGTNFSLINLLTYLVVSLV